MPPVSLTSDRGATNAGYTRTAISLHWLMAALITCGFLLGLVVSDMSFSPAKLRYVAYHKWIGLTVFALAILRLFWRLTHRPPALPAMPAWQTVSARFSHAMLYTLIFLVPLAGWLYSSALGISVVYLRLWRLPDLIGKDRILAESLGQIHMQCAWLMCVIVALHSAAALKHHFVDNDNVLRRMLRSRTHQETHQ